MNPLMNPFSTLRTRVSPVRKACLITVGSLFLFSACHTSPQNTVSASEVAVEPGAYPVTIAHRFGETTITSQPKRIAVYGMNEQSFLLSFGVVPVSDTKFLDDGPNEIGPWALDALHGATPPEVIDITQGGNFKEKIASLHPDLILALYSDINDQTYKSLSEIAPVVAPRVQDGDFITPWQYELTTTGKIVGQPHKAHDILTHVEQRLADFRAHYPQFSHKTAEIAGEDDAQLSILSAKDPRGQFLAALGFSQNPEVAKLSGNSFYTDVSWERTELLNVDVLLWQSEGNINAVQDKLLTAPQFSAIPPIKNHHLVLLNNASADHWAMTESSPLSILWELKRIGPFLDGALAGHIQQIQ